VGIFPWTGRVPVRDLADTTTAESPSPLGVAVDRTQLTNRNIYQSAGRNAKLEEAG